MTKMERAGCRKAVVGILALSGYSINLDGTWIYLMMAALFIAQASDTELSLGQQIGLLFVLLLISKGAAGVTGSGFITLAPTRAANGTVPVAGMALLPRVAGSCLRRGLHQFHRQHRGHTRGFPMG